MESAKTDRNVPEGLERQFNAHGYAFVAAVIAQYEKYSRESQCFWRMPTVEFPVQINGKDAKIDLILSHSKYPSYMIAECKRVDPKYSSWCFFKNPFMNYANRFVCDSLCKSSVDFKFNVRPLINRFGEVYHTGVVLHDNQRKRCQNNEVCTDNRDRDAIESSVSQLCRGMNGFINKFTENKEKIREQWYYFQPVLFTTAKLYTCSTDLKKTNIATGEININDAEVEEKDIIIYNYSQSASIKNSTFDFNHEDLRKYHELDYVRSILVVSSKGINQLLAADLLDI
jgi:hypothetical protein